MYICICKKRKGTLIEENQQGVIFFFFFSKQACLKNDEKLFYISNKEQTAKNKEKMMTLTFFELYTVYIKSLRKFFFHINT